MILASSSPHIVIRMRFSVPEGRTRRRPLTDLTFSSKCDMMSLTASDVASVVFCAGVAGRLTMTWGSLVMILASSLRVEPVSATILVTMRAVSIPSPVGWPGKMMWPDCSPPMGMF